MFEESIKFPDFRYLERFFQNFMTCGNPVITSITTTNHTICTATFTSTAVTINTPSFTTVTPSTCPTCDQWTLCWALLHQHHVLQQWTVPTCARSRLSQVGGQVAAGQEGWAEGEGWLQAALLLGRGHLGEDRAQRVRLCDSVL